MLALAALVLGELVLHLTYPDTEPFPYRSHGAVLLASTTTLLALAAMSGRAAWRRSRRFRVATWATAASTVVAGAMGAGWAWIRSAALENTSMHTARASPLLRTVTVAVEDGRFFEHRGLDLESLHQTLRRSVRSRRFVPSAPTLTLRLARRLVSPGAPTPLRWTQRALLALALESRFQKAELLAAYLDGVDYGMGQRGIGPAARYYFGHEATELELHESVVLVGLAADPPQEWLAEPSLREARTSVLRKLHATPNIRFDRTQLSDAASLPFGRFVLPYLTPRQRGAIESLPAESPHVAFFSYATPDHPTPVGLVAPRLREQILELGREASFLHDVVGFTHFGAFNDRLVRGSLSKVSAHAYGQAFDISGFRFADGSTLRVVDHETPDVERRLAPLEELLHAYCDLVIDWRVEPLHHQDHYHCEVKAERPLPPTSAAASARRP